MIKTGRINDIKRFTIDDNRSLSNLGLSVNKRTLEATTDLHWHEYFEIELILKGSGLHHQNNTTQPFGAGNICFLTPIDFHQVEPLEPLEIINITFNDAWIPSEFLTLFMNKQELSVAKLSDETFEYLKSITVKLNDEFSQDKAYRAFYMKNLINCILCELVHIFPTIVDSSAKDTSNVIRRTLTYLYCNFRNSPSLHEVAEVAGLCDNYFSEVFSKSTGQTFNRFLNDLKLQYAHDLLLHSQKSVTEICFLSGFNSMTHFQREFKKKYNCTPSNKKW